MGSALLRSKQIFLEKTPGLTALDEKALLETTLFGLPMLSVNLPQGRIVESLEGTVVPGLSSVGPGPGADLGLKFANLGVGSSLTPNQKQLKEGTSPGPLATWLSGPGGAVAVRPTQPILPLESMNVTSPVAGLALRGVGFRGGSYTDTPNVVPLTAAPATELRGIHAPFFTDVFFPTQPWTTNFFGNLGGSGATRLDVTPVQHRSNSPTTRRAFGNLDLRLFYSGNTSSYCPGTNPLALAPCTGTAVAPALAAPPSISGVETSYDAGLNELTVRAHVVGDPVAGIQSAWVTWTVPPGAGGGSGGWQSFDLVQDEDDPTLWVGVLGGVANAGAVNFVVQAVNGVGRVTIDDNLGAFYRFGSIPGPGDPGASPPDPTTMTFVTPPPGSVKYGQEFQVKVELKKAGGTPLSGKLVRIGIGGNALPDTTNASGVATVTLRAALTPGGYQVIGSFAGDAADAASDVSANVNVQAQPTTLTLSGTLGTAVPLAVTLKANTSPATPLGAAGRVRGRKGGGVTKVFSGKTDPQGRVEAPASLLSSLPAATFTVDGYFNGVNAPPYAHAPTG